MDKKDIARKNLKNPLPSLPVNTLTKVYIEPTTICNLTCKTCLRNNWTEKGGHMSSETFNNILDSLNDFKSLEKVAFWGIGEPLTHPRITEMIRLAKQLNVKTELITNAMLLDESVAEKLIDSGLDELIVSVDSTNPNQFADIRSGASLQDIINNIGKLNQMKLIGKKGTPEIGIEFTAMKSNISELGKLRELAATIHASFIIVTNVLPYSEEHKDEILYGSSASDSFRKPRSRHNPEINLPRMDMLSENVEALGKIGYEALSLGPQPGVSRNYNGVCPFVEQGSFAISWKGDLSPCIPLMHSYTCYVLGRKKNMVEHSFGNITQETASDIWQKEEYTRFREKVISNSFSPCIDCGGCHLNESNQEDCFGNTHPTCGDCLWARGVIQCP